MTEPGPDPASPGDHGHDHDHGHGHDQVSRAAWLYHAGGLTQAEVAAALGTTTAKAHRLLARAARDGVVRVLVEGPIGGCVAAERALSARFGLSTCRVVPGLGEAGPLPARALGQAGAAFVRQALDGRRDLVVGVGHGRSLAACLRHLPPLNAPGLRLVSLLGGLARLRPANPYEVIHGFAERTGAEAWLVPVPLFASSADHREALLDQVGVREAFALARRASLCLVGIGEVGGEAFLRGAGAVSAQDEATLLAAGAAGEALGHYFDADGRLLATPLHARVLAAPLPLLRGVTAIAGGPAKDAAILAVLRSGVLHGLITDEPTASALLAGRPRGRADVNKEGTSWTKRTTSPNGSSKARSGGGNSSGG